MCIRCLIRGNADRWLAKGTSLRAKGPLPVGRRCMGTTCRRFGPGRARWSGRRRRPERRRWKGLWLQRLRAVCRSARLVGGGRWSGGGRPCGGRWQLGRSGRRVGRGGRYLSCSWLYCMPAYVGSASPNGRLAGDVRHVVLGRRAGGPAGRRAGRCLSVLRARPRARTPDGTGRGGLSRGGLSRGGSASRRGRWSRAGREPLGPGQLGQAGTPIGL